jgi:RNA polymerase sigma factor (sigma-70 family)
MGPDSMSRVLADRARFEAWYAACHKAILGHVLRRVAQPEDGADVIAESFLVAWRRLHEVPEGEEARLWLYGVARRALANQRRGEQRQTALAERLRTELAVAPVTDEPESRLSEVVDALARLPDGERELLRLEGWEGLDARQIATVLGISQNAARIRLHRAPPRTTSTSEIHRRRRNRSR